MPTVIVSLIVAAVLVLAVVQLRRDKKAGKPLCGGQCSNCPTGALCTASRKKDDEEEKIV